MYVSQPSSSVNVKCLCVFSRCLSTVVNVKCLCVLSRCLSPVVEIRDVKCFVCVVSLSQPSSRDQGC